MDAWVNVPVPANGTSSGKKRKVQGASLEDKMQKLTLFNGKLGLHLAARSRVHDACDLKVILLPTKHPVSTAMLEAGRNYYQHKKAAYSKLGSPHLLVWASAILAVRKMPGIDEQDCQLIDGHIAACDAPSCLAQLVNICTVSRAWAPDTVRLEFAVAPALQPVLEVLLKILVSSGGDLKAGPPPRSKYERAIANLLAELGEGPAAAAEQ
mmetsp:Transcript_29921/g.47989  ORF Transcript_29921/g.47989 Transcript_29921/m.47989 type:complete len:210 (+) Transcript_29921:72-701(+)